MAFNASKVTSQTAWYPHILQAGQQDAWQNRRTYIQLRIWSLQAFALPAIVQEEGKLTTNSRWMMRWESFTDKLIVRSWARETLQDVQVVMRSLAHLWPQKRDIDNPDQRISDSAEQQLACRILQDILPLSCAKLCQAVAALPEVFQHDVHPFLRIPICCAP